MAALGFPRNTGSSRPGRLFVDGPVVVEPGSRVANALVIPVSVRDDLADAFGDPSFIESEEG